MSIDLLDINTEIELHTSIHQDLDYNNDLDQWIQCIDEESGFPYLYNNATGESRWL